MINERINDKEVRLIGDDGSQYGIVSLKKAMEAATEKSLDLVKVAPNAVPPVCKLMDYGKYKFELAKKEKEQRKNQKVITVKEVRITPNIDEHDFNTKLSNVIKFLRSGDKVKVTVRFRGREVTHASLGRALLERLGERAEEYGTIESRPKLEGRSMSMFLSPSVKTGQTV